MDTRRFSGPKSVTIYVQFDQPQWDEVRLTVQANGRDDFGVYPDTLAFGKTKKGSTPSASVTVSFSPGNGWAVTDVQTESNYIQAVAKELQQNGAEAGYQLTATVRSDAPVGKWYSDVWLKTNSLAVPRIRVPLTVEIEPALTLSSSSVALGEVRPGAEVERKVVVRGSKPFKITRIDGIDGRWSVQDATTESKPVHVLTIKLKAGDAGELAKKFKVVTDLKEDAEVEFQANAQVIAQRQ
jgi:hypothetical protein